MHHIIQKKLLFILLMAVLLLPLVQKQWTFYKEEPLDGAFDPISEPEFKWFTWKKWMNEDFQEKFNESLEAHIGLKNTLIRLNNQIDFMFFGRSNTHKAIIGKEGCLYEGGYIWEYIGQGFIGKDSANRLLQKTKHLQEFLKKEKNIDLILVFEPGKASYYPEYIPDRFDVGNRTVSNYTYFTQRCKELGITHLDINAWFNQLKDTITYPLYPWAGIHWSTYGMCLASDTLIKFIEHTRGIDMPDIYWDSINPTNELLDADFDLEKTLNLLWRMPSETLAYPNMKFENDSGKTKPSVLTIADSYFWSIYDNGIPQHCFGDHQFWYYNKALYPFIFGDNIVYVDHSKDKEVIESKDVILIMVTEMNLHQGFWGFVDDAYKIYVGSD